jgi:hypothetical protein
MFRYLSNGMRSLSAHCSFCCPEPCRKHAISSWCLQDVDFGIAHTGGCGAIRVYDCSDDNLITTLGEPDDPIQDLTFQNGKVYAKDLVGDIYIWQL